MRTTSTKLKNFCDRKRLHSKQFSPKADSSSLALLEVTPAPKLNTRLLLKKVDAICAKHKKADRDNIRHTLILLQEQPLERLMRALIRGRQFNLQRQRNRVSERTDRAKS
jgi:hypothetical protein